MAIVQKGINAVNDLAETIAGSSYWQKVAPGMKQLQQEVGERLMKTGKVTADIDKGSINAAANITTKAIFGVQGKQTSGPEYEEFAKKLAGRISSEADIEKIFKENASVFGGRDYTPAMNSAKSQLSGIKYNTPEEAYEKAGFFTKLTETPKAYFTNPDKSIRNARIGAAGAGYAIAAVGGRYLSGGTLMKDSYGRRDIAGIPFV